MGASDSKLVFKQSIFHLSEQKSIPANDPYWNKVGVSRTIRQASSANHAQFWALPESTEDIFSLFSPVDVRRTRDSSLANFETLILALISRLTTLRHLPAFPDPDLAPEKEALNCIRVLTRIFPFIYEADHLEAWEDKFFWGTRKKSLGKGQTARTEILFGEAHPDDIPHAREEEQFENVRPLAEELIDTLIDLLFFADFTLPINDRNRNKVTYSIWQSGVGCNTPISSSKELESNRTEILRLLLTICSKSLYMPARTSHAVFKLAIANKK